MDQQKIGTFLKQLRQERQLTQENLAETAVFPAGKTVSTCPTSPPSFSLPIFTAWSCVNC